MSKLLTRSQVVPLNRQWLEQVSKINKHYNPSAASVMSIQLQISMAAFVLESGLSPENAREFIADKLRAFEEQAKPRP